MFYLGCIGFAGYIILDIFEIKVISPLSSYFPFYCLGIGFLGFFTTIIFDKNRKKRTKTGPMGPV